MASRTRSKKNIPHKQLPKDFCEMEWLELSPKGVVFEGTHFILILETDEKKSSSKSAVLPLRFPVQAADLLGALNAPSMWKKSLSFFSSELFKHWNIRFQRCSFIKHEGNKHIVRLFYTKDGKDQFVETALDQVLGLCMESQLPFYATRDYIQKSQVLEPDNEIFLQKQKWTEGGQRYLM